MHSTQGVRKGNITRALPLKPSVPPSIRGTIVDVSGSPFLLNDTKLH